MTDCRQSDAAHTPSWVWALLIGLPALMPISMFWAAYFPPAGTAPTGVYGVDGAVFTTCMRMFDSQFFAPFANCHAPDGTHSPGYFALPFFWLYAVIGAVGRLFHSNEALTLALANGIGGFLYLLAVYRFLRTCFPRQANLAFLLFVLAGGPGGVLYMLTGMLGLHNAPQFEAYFYRYALYQLQEGARPSPILAMPRLYYTASLACCFESLRGFILCGTNEPRRSWAAPTFLLFIGALINQRYGSMTLGILFLYLLVDSRRSLATRARDGLAMTAPVFAAWAIGWLVLRRNPAFIAGTLAAVRTHMWLSPFVSATLFHWIVVPREVAAGVRTLPRLARISACAILGYLAAYVILYTAYNAYYGNIWLCLDYTPAVRFSDWALLGAIPGAACGLLRNRTEPPVPGDGRVEQGWIALWLVCFLAIALSAFGQGWYLRLVPERAMIFLAVPMAIIAASGIQRMQHARPRLSTGLAGVMVGCGACAVVVSALCFQGPLGHRPGNGPFAYNHCELMNQADADLLDLVQQGVVLTPVTYGPSFGDVVVQRPGRSAIYGYGALNFSDRDQLRTLEDVKKFFDAATPEIWRTAFADDWCVDYVYCPDSHPVDPQVLRQLRRIPWLRTLAEQDRAVLFRVVRDRDPDSHQPPV